MEAPLLRSELGPFPLCLYFGPPPGTNPWLWGLYIAGHLGLIVPVPEGSKGGPRAWWSLPLLTAEHLTYIRKLRKQSTFSHSVSKILVPITYPSWLSLLLSQKVTSFSTPWELLILSVSGPLHLVWVLFFFVTNITLMPFPLCKTSTVSRWLVYALVHYIWQ